MKKYIKWGIVLIIGTGLTALGIHTFTPRENEDLASVKDISPTQKNRSLNINAQIIRPHLLTDELFVSGKLMPDEEVSYRPSWNATNWNKACVLTSATCGRLTGTTSAC